MFVICPGQATRWSQGPRYKGKSIICLCLPKSDLGYAGRSKRDKCQSASSCPPSEQRIAGWCFRYICLLLVKQGLKSVFWAKQAGLLKFASPMPCDRCLNTLSKRYIGVSYLQPWEWCLWLSPISASVEVQSCVSLGFRFGRWCASSSCRAQGWAFGSLQVSCCPEQSSVWNHTRKTRSLILLLCWSNAIVTSRAKSKEAVTADFSQAPTTPILSVCIDQGAIGAAPGVEALVPSDCLWFPCCVGLKLKVWVFFINVHDGMGLFLLLLLLIEAAMAYLQHLQMMVHCHCDKIHRVIRDLKLSNNCDSRITEAVLATTYVWSVNYKPAGTGAFGDEKLDALNGFVNTFAMQETKTTRHWTKTMFCTCVFSIYIKLHLGFTVCLKSRAVHSFTNTSSSLHWTWRMQFSVAHKCLMTNCGVQFLNCRHFWQKGGCQNLLDGLPGMSKPTSNCQNSLQHAVS